MKRREFWKFFAAAPAAAVASIAGAKAKAEIPVEGIVIEGNNVMLSNVSLEGAGITIKPGVHGAAIHGCIVRNAK